MTRYQATHDFTAYLSERAAMGDTNAGDAIREGRREAYVGYLYDGELLGFHGRALHAYAKRKTVGNIMVWFTVAQILWKVFELWVQWREDTEDSGVPI